jgi:peptidoglycan glycosyltransferase
MGAGAALAAFTWVFIADHSDHGRPAAKRFAAAVQRQNFRAMYAEIDPEQRRAIPLNQFENAYNEANTTATTLSLKSGKLSREHDDDWKLEVTARTRAFGLVKAPLRFTVTHGRVQWHENMTFPGVNPGERLNRRTRAPKRARLLARNGRKLADVDPGGLAGQVGKTSDANHLRDLARSGFPDDAQVGISGLQEDLDVRLRGRAGGTLLAGNRVLARSQPVRARDVTTSIDPKLQQAAVNALGGRFGGVAVTEPATGEVLALAGIADDATQPPGSTFKIITVTGALEAHQVTLKSKFPVETGHVVGGRFLANAHNEACGGDLTESFSKSCNSVFAPMGVKLGARKLVSMTERFGFNRPPGIPGAVVNQIPKADEFQSEDELGSSAIGQGRVVATPLGMAVAGATIANGGRRALLTLVHGDRPRYVHVTTPQIARTVTQLMLAVVNGAGATGNSAAIPGQHVAGKTGTSELGGDQENDAWFVAFAPAEKARLAVGVLVVHGGFGGETAAPIAREVLKAGL